MAEYLHVKHTFAPVYDEKSKILILGSLPSVKSREQGFYYGHPKNRFWLVLSGLLNWKIPITIEEKKEMLLENGIAIWDVLDSCDIIGSSDSTIKNPVAADIQGLLQKTSITQIYANGGAAGKYYRKLVQPKTRKEITILQSTSPLNCRYSLEELIQNWRIIMQ
ncbi:MAG: DNA-deoxyinosine glycosylase [Lachnospiraceae bacterium]|nr:DNA-deoxyinosine glycosylase [Lachnospiraceae bacterium]MDD7051044.1 DNA-deoxyinosine glycosylase [Lachnospiraceae bacterium]MDY3223308.1 DNA-deoxyinosine glycosylase [Lachnospiraceae bacterium]MDY4096205.1 DNA-deoxyinosine glycosylase [Lachnospiraceae bacterium]